MRHRGDELVVAPARRILIGLAGQDGLAHIVDAASQLAQLVISLNRDRIVQVAALQDMDLVVKRSDGARLAKHQQHEHQRESRGRQSAGCRGRGQFVAHRVVFVEHGLAFAIGETHVEGLLPLHRIAAGYIQGCQILVHGGVVQDAIVAVDLQHHIPLAGHPVVERRLVRTRDVVLVDVVLQRIRCARKALLLGGRRIDDGGDSPVRKGLSTEKYPRPHGERDRYVGDEPVGQLVHRISQ